MNKKIRNLLAVTLAGSIVLSLASCRKHKTVENKIETQTSETADSDDNTAAASDVDKNAPKTLTKNPTRIIKDDEIFYESESTELKLEPIPDVELATKKFTTSAIAGDRILVDVDVTLKDESQAKTLLANGYQNLNDYEYHSLQLFDLTGKNIATIPLDEDCEFASAFAMENGEIFVTVFKTDMGECKSFPAFFVISPSGEKLRDLNYDVGKNLFGSHAYLMDNGNLFIAAEGELYLFDAQGKLIKKTEEQTLAPFMNYSDGKWLVAHYALPSSDVGGYQEVDVNTGELTEKYKVDKNLSIALTGNSDCFIFSDAGIEQYSIIQSTTTPIVSYANSNLNCAFLTNCQMQADGSMLALNAEPDKDNGRWNTDCYCYYANTMSIEKLTRADKNPHAGKELLKICTYDISDPYFTDMVYKYNADPENHAYIELTSVLDDDFSYFRIHGEEHIESLSSTYEYLTEKMYKGEGPDMVVGFSGLSELNTDALLYDLKPYLEADTTIKKEDYFYNLFSAFEQNGKLYSFPLTFSLLGMYANSEISDVSEKWTFDELSTIQSKLSFPKRIMPSYASTNIFTIFMSSSSSDFINNETGEVNFDNDDFKALLQAAKKCGVAEPEYNDGLDNFYGEIMDPQTQYYRGYLFSHEAYMSTLEDYAIVRETYMNDNDKLISYPSVKGKSLTALGGLTISVTKCASNPDLAWEFIRFCLNEDAQEYLSAGMGKMPVSRSAFDAVCKIQIDQNAAFNKEFENDPDYHGPFPILIDDGRREELAKLIDSIDNAYYQDCGIMMAIYILAEGYFKDLDTLDNTCIHMQKVASDIMDKRK